MGFLDVIARNLAHITDATRSINTLRPEAEDPTTALQSAIDSRRGRFQNGPNPLDDLVIDPTVRIKYTEKMSLVEMTEAENARRALFDPISTPRSRRVDEALELPAPTEKELFAMTKKVNPHGVRFVGDRVGWDRCLADLAEEERRRQVMGDAYVPRQSSAERRRRMRRNASLRQRVASITNSELADLDGDAEDVEMDGFDDAEHYSSDEDHALSVYDAMEGRGPSHERFDEYSDKIRKLRAPRLQPKNFTHVHRCVGTEDAAAPPDFEGASSQATYSYARKKGASSSQSANKPPFAIVGKRAKIVFYVLTFVSVCFTIALWAYLSHLRYYFSGDKAFNNGGLLYREGQLKTTFDVDPNNSYAIVNVTEDPSLIWIKGSYERVKSGTIADSLGESAMNLLGAAYLSMTMAGLAYTLLTGIYVVCFVNGIWYRSNVRDILTMRQVSKELRSIDRRAELASRALGSDNANIDDGISSTRSPAGLVSSPDSRIGPLSSMGIGSPSPFGFMMSPFPGSMHPSWQPEIPENKRIDEHDDLDSRVELKYGWLKPVIVLPISATDFLLANPSKEKKKGFALLQALFIPAWILGLIPTIVFFVFVSDAIDNYSVSVLAYSVGSADIPVYLALCALSIFEFLPVLYIYHKFALRFVESRYH